MKDGNIIAIIITAHMPRNDAAPLAHDCPGIRIHTIDIIHPPGIRISPIRDMDVHQIMAVAALTAKSNAEMPNKVCREARSEATPLSMMRPKSTVVEIISKLSLVLFCARDRVCHPAAGVGTSANVFPSPRF
jgi:hypothetical protein